MVPPIKALGYAIPVTPERAKSLTDEEISIVQAESQRRLSVNLKNSQESAEKLPEKESKKTKESEAKIKIDYKFLLNKPNMTIKDKDNMEKSIKFLIDKKMDTPENIKKLEAIIYYETFIEIGGVKRARENLKAEPNKNNIFKHGNEIYFKFTVLKEQNKLLANQGMGIPGKDDFVKVLQALPGDFSESDWYTGANILGNILDLSMSGGCDDDGKFFYEYEYEGDYGCVWSSSAETTSSAWGFRFHGRKGKLGWDNRNGALPVRPIFK